jgi:hypothetical protein
MQYRLHDIMCIIDGVLYYLVVFEIILSAVYYFTSCTALFFFIVSFFVPCMPRTHRQTDSLR